MGGLSPRGGGRREATVLGVASRIKAAGILPSCQLTEWVLPDARVGGWGLPGHGRIKDEDPSYGCGTFWRVGCLNVSKHDAGLDGRRAGMVYVKVKKRSCGRPECPKCYESWAAREAKRIERRVGAYKMRRGKPIHFMVSPPERDWSLSSVRLKSRAFEVARAVGFHGGSCIFHPFREDEPTKRWYVSPHFHMIGYGWIKGAAENYEISGWVAKNLGVRESVSATAFYQLSHAGVWYGQGRKHSVTWFGCLSYSKLQVTPEAKEVERCPLCQLELVKLLWSSDSGSCPVPDEVGEYFVEPQGWFKMNSSYG
jgi:hypothetical protein